MAERPPISFPELDTLCASVQRILQCPEYFHEEQSIRDALEAICTSIAERGDIEDKSPEGYDMYEPLLWKIVEMRDSLEDSILFLASASLETEISLEGSSEGPVCAFVTILQEWNSHFLALWDTWKTDPPKDHVQPISQYITVERSEKLAMLCRRNRKSIISLRKKLDKLSIGVNIPVTVLETPGDYPPICVGAMRGKFHPRQEVFPGIAA
mgnify:FL=1